MKKLFSLFVIIALIAIFSQNLFAQNVTVSGAVSGNGTYSTLRTAFVAINAGTQTGSNILVTVVNNTNEGTSSAALNAGTWTTLTINPSGNRTITGGTTANSPLLDLIGSDNVTIDGLNTSGNSLTISNTSIGTTAGSSTIRFRNGATNNLVTNCTILGSTRSTIATASGTILFHTTTSTGNNNNTISYCNIGPAGVNLPSKGITAVGTNTSSSTWNTNNLIDNNNIYDFFLASNNLSGIYIDVGNQNWTITNNRMYQTAPRAFTNNGLRFGGITINGSNTSGSTHTISSNIIGFGNSSGTGTTTISGSSNEFRGIDIQSSNSSTFCSIQGNTISGIIQTTSRSSTNPGFNPFIGIQSGSADFDGPANIGNITGNTIGSLDGSSSIIINATSITANTVPVCGIFDFNYLDNVSISNNNIGSITINSGGSGTVVGFRGIHVSAIAGISRIINNNTIGGNITGSITNNIVGTNSMYGIQTWGPHVTMIGNTIRNMTGNSTGLNIICMSGIITSGSTGVNTISQNTIHSLHNNSGSISNSIYTLYPTFPATANIVDRNFIHSISINSTNTDCQIVGILSGTTGTATYKNNMVRLGLNAAGSSITSGFTIMGIWDYTGSTSSYYNNTVYIGGTGVVSVYNTYAFNSYTVNVTRIFQNNIFWNARSNSSGGFANFSIGVGGTGVNPAGLTCNNNLLLASGTNGVLGYYNLSMYGTITGWRTATGQDTRSISSEPLLISPNGSASIVDLHIDPSDLTVSGRGTFIASVNNDFDGNSRPTSPSSTVKPVDIGADQYTPTSYNGNILAVTEPGVLSDGNLKAIELTSGSFNFMQARQYTGVRAPNNTLLKQNSSVRSRYHDSQKMLLPEKNFKNAVEENTAIINNVTSELRKAEEINNSDKQFKTNINKSVNQPKNKILNDSPEEINNKKQGTPGGNSGNAAVNTPWVYWEIDNLTPVTEPITLRFYYNEDQLATIPEADLKISYWNGTVWINSFTQSVSVLNNYIEVTLPTGQSWGSTALFSMEDNSAPLPVVMSTFDMAVSNRDISLNWATETEINNKGFSIERRVKTPDNQYSVWKEVSFITGKGNSTSRIEYSYTDKKLNSGAYQYRLKQVDYNGNYEYHSPANNSDMVIGKPGSFDISQNYPNPSNPKSKIDFSMPFDGKVSIKVYDILGKEVASLINEFKPADFYTVEFDGSNVSSGTYFYRIIAEGNNQKFTKTMKMILVK